jgi:hypothetical protein
MTIGGSHGQAAAEIGLARRESPSEDRTRCQNGVFPMPVQIVTDRTGDTRHRFDAGDRAAVEEPKSDLSN